MAEAVDKMTVRVMTRWWFSGAARALAVASIVLPKQITGWIIDRLCDYGVYIEDANA